MRMGGIRRRLCCACYNRPGINRKALQAYYSICEVQQILSGSQKLPFSKLKAAEHQEKVTRNRMKRRW